MANHKCYACGSPGHFARDKVCPARVKRVQSAVGRGTGQNVADMRRMESRARPLHGRASGSDRHQKRSVTCKPPLRPKQQINQVEYDSEDEPFVIPVNFSGETVENVKITL